MMSRTSLKALTNVSLNISLIFGITYAAEMRSAPRYGIRRLFLFLIVLER